MTETILVPLAPGFEEIEAVTVIDVLRRAELDVFVAGLAPGPVTGSHGITLATDGELGAVDPASLAMMVLPGGLPGATNLMEDERVLALLTELAGSQRSIAAICAAPIVLGRAGLLEGLEATCYPGFEDRLGGASAVQRRVVRSGRVVTSRGPGTALEFALELVAELAGRERAEELERAMLVSIPAE